MIERKKVVGAVEIRPPKLEDKKTVLELLTSSMSPAYAAELEHEFQSTLLSSQSRSNNDQRQHYIGFIAADAANALNPSHILGYACIRPQVQTYKLETIAVRANTQGQGVGSRLIESIWHYVLRSGANILHVDTDSQAKETIQFYLKNGFERAGHVEDEYILGVTQLHLRRRA